MKVDLSKYSYTGEWFDFKDGVKVKVRAYPQSMNSMAIRGGAIELTGADGLKMFDYCLVEAEGLDITINDEAQGLTPSVKKIIFDFDVEGLPAFVLDKARQLAARRDDASKN